MTNGSVQAILSHPLALVKLGMFLRDVAAMRLTRKRKPIVLVGPADARQHCLVVAVTCEPMSGEALQVCFSLCRASAPEGFAGPGNAGSLQSVAIVACTMIIRPLRPGPYKSKPLWRVLERCLQQIVLCWTDH